MFTFLWGPLRSNSRVWKFCQKEVARSNLTTSSSPETSRIIDYHRFFASLLFSFFVVAPPLFARFLLLFIHFPISSKCRSSSSLSPKKMANRQMSKCLRILKLSPRLVHLNCLAADHKRHSLARFVCFLFLHLLFFEFSGLS